MRAEAEVLDPCFSAEKGKRRMGGWVKNTDIESDLFILFYFIIYMLNKEYTEWKCKMY